MQQTGCAARARGGVTVLAGVLALATACAEGGTRFNPPEAGEDTAADQGVPVDTGVAPFDGGVDTGTPDVAVDAGTDTPPPDPCGPTLVLDLNASGTLSGATTTWAGSNEGTPVAAALPAPTGCTPGSPGHQVVLRYTPRRTTRLRISTVHTATVIDTVVWALDRCQAAGASALGCNDDPGDAGTASDFTTAAPVMAGTAVFVVVASYGPATGRFALSVTELEGADGGADAGVDVPRDTGVDVGMDAGPDSGRDTGVDTGVDAGVDGGGSARGTPVIDGMIGSDWPAGAWCQRNTVVSSWGPTLNALSRLCVAYDDTRLYLGLEGVVEDTNGIALFLDVDYAGTTRTGVWNVASLTDEAGAVDALLSCGANVTEPRFGAEFAWGTRGMRSKTATELLDTVGLRGVACSGCGSNFGWFMGDQVVCVRTGTPTCEVAINWSALYPTLRPAMPRLAVFATVANAAGSSFANQALPEQTVAPSMTPPITIDRVLDFQPSF